MSFDCNSEQDKRLYVCHPQANHLNGHFPRSLVLMKCLSTGYFFPLSQWIAFPGRSDELLQFGPVANLKKLSVWHLRAWWNFFDSKCCCSCLVWSIFTMMCSSFTEYPKKSLRDRSWTLLIPILLYNLHQLYIFQQHLPPFKLFNGFIGQSEACNLVFTSRDF